MINRPMRTFLLHKKIKEQIELLRISELHNSKSEIARSFSFRNTDRNDCTIFCSPFITLAAFFRAQGNRREIYGNWQLGAR